MHNIPTALDITCDKSWISSFRSSCQTTHATRIQLGRTEGEDKQKRKYKYEKTKRTNARK